MLINTNIAIIEARFYEDISDMLVTGTEHILNKYNATFEKFRRNLIYAETKNYPLFTYKR